MLLCYNNKREKSNNSVYPYKLDVKNIEDLIKVVLYDHVGAEYENNYRKNDNFICTDCSMFDVDNTDTEDSSKWITPEHLKEAFPNVPFYISYSRNHMKSKNGKQPRPKFHVYFPDKKFENMSDYKSHKNKVCDYFSAFDRNAKDVARFFYGVENPKVEYFEGNILLYDFMQCVNIDRKEVPNDSNIIPEGVRNNTLLKYALKMLKRYGDKSGKAHNLYIKKSLNCSPLLDDSEVCNIWKSALKYYNDKIKSSEDYISPEEYNDNNGSIVYKPKAFTDLGQAEVFSKLMFDKVRYSHSTNYLYYNGKVWKEDDLKVQGLAQQLTRNQLREARLELKMAQAKEDIASVKGNSSEIEDAKNQVKLAEKYRNFVLSSQHTQRISGLLKEAHPMLQIDYDILDNDGFKLNTPSGTVDLKTKEIKQHDYKDYCTKITALGPSDKGADIFKSFLDVITCEDDELIEYLQYIAGMIAVGKVFCEHLIIAYGCGRNGKSTFFNLISKVLGDYSGCLSSEILTSNSRKNKSFEYAELRGKRLVISAELEQDTNLDTSVVKKLCSTDPIQAEKKYKAPFSFIPSHTVVLYTNHLPKVGALDNGTWRRLVIVPFNAVIKSNNEIKNYADYLFEHSGCYVMKWIIEGAYKFISSGYKLFQPKVVEQAINVYRSENDWLNTYIEECCSINKTYKQASGALYSHYRDYCKQNGEFTRSNASFVKALLEKGFIKKKECSGSYIYGLRISSTNNKFEKIELPDYLMTLDDIDIHKNDNTSIVF